MFNPFQANSVTPSLNFSPPLPLKGPMGTTKEVLFLGEGNFQFSAKVCEQEDLLYNPSDAYRFKFSNYVIVTEYKTESECNKYPGTKKRITSLRHSGALPQFGTNAKTLHVHYPTTSLKMILFNCPDAKFGDLPESLSEASGSDPTVELVSVFFGSARRVQPDGARIYLTLLQPEESENDCIYYQGHKYGVVDAASSNGYRLIDIREVLDYDHQKTAGHRKVQDAANGMKQLVFEKLEAPFDDPSIVEGSCVDRVTGEETSVRYYRTATVGGLTGYDHDLREITGKIFEIEAEKREKERLEKYGELSSSEESSSDDDEVWNPFARRKIG